VEGDLVAAVGLVKAYLEQCGYFVLTELPLREPVGDGYGDLTDVDILAVRFPHDPVPEGHQHDAFDLLNAHDAKLETFGEGVDVVIGEVKAGKASLNPAFRRERTIAFALRRLGCCPKAEAPALARRIAQRGRADMRMSDGPACRVRLVAFAGQWGQVPPATLTIPLVHCADFIERHMGAALAAVADAQFMDPVLCLFAKLGSSRSGLPDK
jgi:hypothetical protein